MCSHSLLFLYCTVPFSTNHNANATVIRLNHEWIQYTAEAEAEAEEFSNHAVTVNVSGGMSAAGQTVPLTSKLADVVDFGKYLTFTLQGEEIPSTQSQKPVVDAFQRMRDGQRSKVWPKTKCYNIARPNRRHELHNVLWTSRQIFLG